MKIKTRLQISRASSNVQDDYINIRISDEASGVQFVELEVPLAEFASALTAMSVGDIPAEVRGLDLIGKRREHKGVTVQIARGLWGEEAMEAVQAAIVEHEVDGWKASEYDLKTWNAHRLSDRDDGYRDYSVGLHRYVDPE